METVCQACGDQGYTVALIYCYDCDEVAVHRYCLDVLPKTFEEYVVWFCDDCKPLHWKQNSIKESHPHSPKCNGSRDLKSVSSTAVGENDSQNLKASKLTRPRGRSEKKARKRKRMARTEKEQKGPDEGKESSCSTAKTDVSESTQLPQASCSRSYVSGQIEDKPSPNAEDDKSSTEDAESSKNLSPLPILDSSRTPMDIDYIPVQPIIDPIWTGVIQIGEDKTGYFCRIRAHLSQLACSRVREEAKLFPDKLSSELHPRSTVWPKGFEQCGPRDENIALYFFPESESSSDEKVFKGLISEMIRRDLAIRTVVAHAELLVFTSTKLPLRLWRFQGKLYLWGVFRKKQDTAETPKSSGVSAEKDLSQAVGTNFDNAIAVLQARGVNGPGGPGFFVFGSGT